jgi:predicted kinase
MNKLIILNGPSGAGKSTVARILWKKMGRTALVGLDEIKWLISDYKSDNHDLTLAGNIGLNMAEIFLVDGLDVIVEKAFCKQEYIQPFIDLADKLGISYFLFNIEAPLEILIERSKNRSMDTNQKFNEEKVRRICAEYQENKVEARTFDTDKNSTEEIADKVFKLST